MSAVERFMKMNVSERTTNIAVRVEKWKRCQRSGASCICAL